MADCSKTEVFLAELDRMCCSCDALCNGCGFEEEGDCTQISILCECGQAVVQKWSDEHPALKPKTYADKFFEMFPKAVREGYGDYPIGACKRKIFDGTYCDNHSHCEICWNEPYKED